MFANLGRSIARMAKKRKLTKDERAELQFRRGLKKLKARDVRKFASKLARRRSKPRSRVEIRVGKPRKAKLVPKKRRRK